MNVTMGTIVGRDAELRQIDVVLDGGGALLLEGEPGIGKTTVWREAIARAERQGFRVLRARPAESEARLSHAALADLLAEAFDETSSRLPAPQVQALEVAMLRGGGAADPRTIATGLRSVVATIAAESPLVVAVDDVQWLDRASERALEFLARRLPGNARLLLTRRTTEAAPAPLGLDRAAPETPVERITLGPLSLAALHHLIAAHLELTLPRPTLARLQQVSGGNPFFALEIARSLHDWRPSLGESLPIPADVRGVVGERLGRLPQRGREALLRAAALTRPTTAIVPAAELEAAETAGIVRIEGDRIEFAHPLLASTVYADATAVERRAAHAQLAERVVELEERARHTSLAATGPDEEVARLLDAAAAQARRRGAPDEAAELQEKAALLTPDGDSAPAHRRVAAAAEHFFRAGDPRRAQALLERVLPEVTDRAVRSECLRLLGELRFTENSFPAAIDLLEEALLYMEAPGLTIPTRQDLAYAYLSVQDKPAAVRQTQRAVAIAEQHGDPALLGEALALDAVIGYLCGGPIAREQIERAVELEDETRQIRLQMRPSAIAAMLAVSDGRLTEAVERLHVVCDAAVARGEESELPLLLAYLASAEWRRAGYDAAAEAADAILRIGTQTGNEPALAIGTLHRAMSATFRGDAVSARADFELARELMEKTGWALGAAYTRMGQAFLELSAGDPAAADRVLEPVTAAVENGDWSDPELALFAPDAIEARAALGRLERADELLRALERNGESAWAQTEAHRCRALCLAAAGDLAGAAHAADTAVERAATLEMPFVQGRALLVAGQVRRRLRQKRLAKEALESALAVFEEIGTPLWAARAREELGRIGLRAPAPEELTGTERRIAELAASGLTNREVAQAAFVSPKTVEANLGRVYRKLGIRSRAELGAWLAERQT
jgi:DNA-binding CsgD family transcriptional regulator